MPATHHKSPPQQAGRACVVLCAVFDAYWVVLKMLIQVPGNLLCFAVALGLVFHIGIISGRESIPIR